MKKLIDELGRRRVFRVAGGYLVGAWIVLQVAATLFPALRMPQWTVTLVAVTVVLGFPISLLLGWAFDLTPDGLERTADLDARGAAAAPRRFPMRAAAAGTLLVTLGVIAFFSVRRHVVALRLDENAVLVLPFRVAGDASLGVLREGMVDLMAAKLTGEGGPRAVDSRTALSAWKRTVDSPDDDLTPDQAMRLARRLGAAQVLLGEVVSAGGDVVINATLHSAVSRPVRTQQSAPADSLLGLVDRVVAMLLSERAGEAHRAGALLSESLPAVRAYLDGQRLYRRGSYAEAAGRYSAALDQDSTFALAAFGLALTRSWAGYGPEYQRGQRLAYAFRDQLPQRDREFLLAWIGEDYPTPRSVEQTVRAWEDIVAAAPDRVEAWYHLGDQYFHNGRMVGYDNSDQRALDAWSRAAALDSAFAPAIAHQVEVYAFRGDTAEVRRISDFLFERLGPENRLSSSTAWVAATALEDEAWLNELRSRTQSSNTYASAALSIEMGGLPQSDLDMLHQAVVDGATPGARFFPLLSRAFSELNRGRPAAAARTLTEASRVSEHHAGDVYGFAISALFPDADSADFARRRAQVEAYTSGAEPMEPGAITTYRHARCSLELWRVMTGRLHTATSTVAQLREWTAATPHDGTTRPCAYAVQAIYLSQVGASDAEAAAMQLDSVLLHTFVEQGWHEYFAIMSARVWQHLGDRERARAALNRFVRDQRYARAPLLLERARVEAGLGYRDDAIATYRQYLRLRPDPEPGRASDLVAEARAELARLIEEPRS